MNKEFYTKLVYEHKFPDDFGPTRIEVSRTAWDLGGEDMMEMFHTIMLGASYTEDTFKGILIEYLQDHCGVTVQDVAE